MRFAIRNVGRSSIAPLFNAQGVAKIWSVTLNFQIGNIVHGNALKILGTSPYSAKCAAKSLIAT